MTLKLKKYKERYVIDLEGELDLYNAYKLKTLYQKMTEKGIQSIVINLENLDYLDSSGLGSRSE
jgi:anti-sigma B factor antagonist